MAILPQERFSNVVNSLFSYIETNYTLTQKEFQGQNALDTKTVKEWVWFGAQVASRRYERQVTHDNTRGNIVSLFVTAHIMVKPSNNFLRVTEIRDTIVNLLRWASIQMQDYAGGTGLIGKLTGKDIFDEVDMGFEADINRYRVTFLFDYIEQFTP